MRKAEIGYRQGKILTVIDASYPDGNQLKAVKDLVREEFSWMLSEIIGMIPWKIEVDIRKGELG